MASACEQEQTRSWALHPGWALLFAGVPLAAGIHGGPLFIDDAYITFRYAENLVRGAGFVYNSEPVLGTTAPFYCLLLYLSRAAGISMEAAALSVGVISGAAAPLLVWRIGACSRNPGAGFLGALLLCLFPIWWLNSKSGMETSLAGALAAAAIYFQIRNKGAASGVLSGLLVLTRPDSAILPVILFALMVYRDRRQGIFFAVAGLAVLLPWIIFAAAYFGSPLPHSLEAKKMIHAFPFHLALKKYLAWFLALESPAGMAAVSGAWIIGAAAIFRSWREALAVALWPPLFLLGLAATQVGPFFWYKIPLLPVYFLAAGYGLHVLLAWRGPGREGGGKWPVAARAAALLVAAVFIVLQMYSARQWLARPDSFHDHVEKERILASQAEYIRRRCEDRGLVPAEVGVYAGEVGVIGYVLLGYEIIDSAGINSPEVLEARKRDWENLIKINPGLTWREQQEGSPAWSRELIARFEPRYIVSNTIYLHLLAISREPGFQDRYQLIQVRTDGQGNKFALYEKKEAAAVEPGP